MPYPSILLITDILSAGHSDLLAGIVVVKTEAEWHELHHDRTYLGNNAVRLKLLTRSPSVP